MGCGSSNTLETRESINKEMTQHTQYKKLIGNVEILNKIIEDGMKDNLELIENEKEVDKFIEEMNIEYKESFNSGKKRLSEKEKKDALIHILAKEKINNELIYKVHNVGDLLVQMLKNTSESRINLTSKIFCENIGEIDSALYLGLNEPRLGFLVSSVLQILKYDEEYSNINSIVILLPEIEINNKETMNELALLIKGHRNLKNFVLGISDDEVQPIEKMDNLSYLFEGI